jgi:3-oxoacyl-[acyl-carrier-protein] synthase-3
MAASRFDNVRITGIASAVPASSGDVGENAAFPEKELSKISASTGVRRRHVVDEKVCTSDLCHAAAERILEEIGWPRESIDVLIFVSQTPDYILPATACALHGRLGLPPGCAAFDVNLGCSGYVYGLWLAANLLNGGAKRVLLLAGDTISRLVSPLDRSVAFLFGDAGTATTLESQPGAPSMYFELGTDGAGKDHLIVPAGGFRSERSARTAVRSEQEGGNIRSQQDLYMNGGEIFAFTMSVVPEMCASVLRQAGWPMESVDAFVMHQANRFILQHLSKRMQIPEEKLILALENYGNTSSASIPLAMNDVLGQRLRTGSDRLLLAGFGVGFSWAAAAIVLGPLAMPQIVRLAG